MGDPLDDEIEVMVPLTCRAEGCTKLFCPGGFGRPFTARKIIDSIRREGWKWIEGSKPTSGSSFCAEHGPDP